MQLILNVAPLALIEQYCICRLPDAATYSGEECDTSSQTALARWPCVLGTIDSHLTRRGSLVRK
jgi:hypothetical protein